MHQMESLNKGLKEGQDHAEPPSNGNGNAGNKSGDLHNAVLQKAREQLGAGAQDGTLSASLSAEDFGLQKRRSKMATAASMKELAESAGDGRSSAHLDIAVATSTTVEQEGELAETSSASLFDENETNLRIVESIDFMLKEKKEEVNISLELLEHVEKWWKAGLALKSRVSDLEVILSSERQHRRNEKSREAERCDTLEQELEDTRRQCATNGLSAMQLRMEVLENERREAEEKAAALQADLDTANRRLSKRGSAVSDNMKAIQEQRQEREELQSGKEKLSDRCKEQAVLLSSLTKTVQDMGEENEELRAKLNKTEQECQVWAAQKLQAEEEVVEIRNLLEARQQASRDMGAGSEESGADWEKRLTAMKMELICLRNENRRLRAGGPESSTAQQQLQIEQLFEELPSNLDGARAELKRSDQVRAQEELDRNQDVRELSLETKREQATTDMVADSDEFVGADLHKHLKLMKEELVLLRNENKQLRDTESDRRIAHQQRLHIEQLGRENEELRQTFRLQVEQGKDIMEEQFTQFATNQKDLKEALRQKENTIYQQRHDMKQLQLEADDVRSEKLKQDEQIKALKMMTVQSDQALQDMRAEVLSLRTLNRDELENQQASTQALESLKAQLLQLEKEKASLSTELDLLRKDHVSLSQHATLQAQNQSLQAQHQSTQRELEELSSKHGALQQEFELIQIKDLREDGEDVPVDMLSPTHDLTESQKVGDTEEGFEPSLVVYDRVDDEVGLKRIICIIVPGRHLDDEQNPTVTGKVQPLANGVFITLAKKSNTPDEVTIVTAHNFVDPVGSWEWRYEPTDGIWQVCTCWGLAHGIFALALAKVPDGQLYAVERVGNEIATLPSATPQIKPALETDIRRSAQKPKKKVTKTFAQASAHFAMITFFGAASTVQGHLLRDTTLILEDGSLVQVADLAAGMCVRGPGKCAEVKSVEFLAKQEHKVITLYAGLEGITVPSEQMEQKLTAAAYTEDGAAISDWAQHPASQLLAGRHEMALYSAEVQEAGAAITGVRRFIRSTALAKVEFKHANCCTVFAGLQSAMPKTAVVDSSTRRRSSVVERSPYFAASPPKGKGTAARVLSHGNGSMSSMRRLPANSAHLPPHAAKAV